MDSEHTRRRVLELAGVGAGLPLAGRVGGGTDAATPPDETATATRTLQQTAPRPSRLQSPSSASVTSNGASVGASSGATYPIPNAV